jgi:hypothetical protein
MYIYIWYVFTYVPDVYIYMVAVHLQIEFNSNIEPFLPNSGIFLGHGVNPRYPKNGIVLSAQFVERCNLFVGSMGHGFV